MKSREKAASWNVKSPGSNESTHKLQLSFVLGTSVGKNRQNKNLKSVEHRLSINDIIHALLLMPELCI